MAASVEIRVEGQDAIERRLRAIQERGEDLSPLMDAIGLAMEGSTLQRFEDERGPDGSRWTPSRRVEQFGGKTLTLSARLKQSVSYIALADSVRVGTNVIYAGVHQHGATIVGRNGPLRFKLPGIGFRSARQVIIPARPMFGIGDEDEDEIEALTEDFFGLEAA
ncbi:phage virion morphogenesis protein [Sphingomonas naphthae]|uniref:Phage virion morphogenesis protein n=1 Tax=Sphingomonas naphthae TaxID=1813468 RepID=A0ABY7TG75_9SPHN|nr:phage virion morphogenesis protein [Sphingomonas naphthae]WCT72058.1 phage virion morphogenesis protein [Sphingomonas naphthae]